MQDPHFDFDQIHQLVRTIREHNAGWRAWFARFGVRPSEVRYEELITDLARVVRDVLAFLGLQPPRDLMIVPQHHRQADVINADWIARYRLLTARSGD
jgi:LPS sulfotransferase NodH